MGLVVASLVFFGALGFAAPGAFFAAALGAALGLAFYEGEILVNFS